MNNIYKQKETSQVHFHFIFIYDVERITFVKKYQDEYFEYNVWKCSFSKFK